jgi:hypothetical protein
MTAYKVMPEQDSAFRGKFDAESIESTLNEHAAEGWRLVGSFSVTNLKTFGGQVMMILERPRP